MALKQPQEKRYILLQNVSDFIFICVCRRLKSSLGAKISEVTWCKKFGGGLEPKRLDLEHPKWTEST